MLPGGCKEQGLPIAANDRLMGSNWVNCMPGPFVTRWVACPGFVPRDSVNEVSDVPSPTADAPAPSWGLWALCLTVMAAVIVAWASDRAKPLVVFPVLLGATLGGAATLLANYCQLPRRRSAVAFVTVGAALLVVVSFIVTAERHQRDLKPANPLAERLLQQFERQTPVVESPTVPRFEPYLQQRYGMGPRWRTMGMLLGEAALSAVAAIVVMRVFWSAVHSSETKTPRG